MSEDGKTIHFKIREGMSFASGNPMTAEDVVFSLQRAVKLDKSPAFILTQFGFTADNVEEMITQTGDFTFDFTMDKPYAPTFALYCLTATVAMVVDKKLVLEHEVDGDLGYNWLKTAYAGSGPFTIREWRANEVVVLERNPNYSGEAPAMARAIYRHIPEPATERLLLEQGDIDIARKIGPDEIDALSQNPDIVVEKRRQGLDLLPRPQPEEREPRQARGAAGAQVPRRLPGDRRHHPQGHGRGAPGVPADRHARGARGQRRSRSTSRRRRSSSPQAGLPDGFTVTMDTRNTFDITGIAEAMQQTFAQAGITLEIIPGDGQQTLTKYRAREHDIYIGRWGPDYQDPHTNADTFARNPDNGDDAASKPLAWRNAWDIPEMTKAADAAVLEQRPRQARRHVRRAAEGEPGDLALRHHVPGDRGDRPAQRTSRASSSARRSRTTASARVTKIAWPPPHRDAAPAAASSPAGPGPRPAGSS